MEHEEDEHRDASADGHLRSRSPPRPLSSSSSTRPHVNACKATTGEGITEDQQRLGQTLWACSNATGKSGVSLRHAEAARRSARVSVRHRHRRHHVRLRRGRRDGRWHHVCATTIYPNAHLPYTAVVPAYTSADTAYLAQVQTAVPTTRRASWRRTARGSKRRCN